MKADQRTVKYYDLVLKASIKSKDGEVEVIPPPLLEILKEIEKIFLSGVTIESEAVGRKIVWVLAGIEIEQNGQKAVLLINKIDKLAADQSISNENDPSSLWVPEKSQDEGNAYSSHVGLKLTEIGNARYLMLVEDAPGIGIRRIGTIIAKALYHVRKQKPRCFFYPNGNGGKNAKPYFAKIKYTVYGHPSENFVDELNKGTLNNIELIRPSKDTTSWDEYKATKEKAQTVSLGVSGHLFQNTNVLKSVFQKSKKNDYSTVRVKFKDVNKMSYSVSFDAESEKVLNEDRFVKKVLLVNFSQRLDTGFRGINQEIKRKIYFLLNGK